MKNNAGFRFFMMLVHHSSSRWCKCVCEEENKYSRRRSSASFFWSVCAVQQQFESVNQKRTMSSAEHLKQLVRERLSDVAEEIFAVFHKAILEYEDELKRYRKYFGAAMKPVIMLRRIGQ